MSERLGIPAEVKAAGVDVRSLMSFQNMFKGERPLGVSEEVQQLGELDNLEALEILFPKLPTELRPLAAEILREVPQAVVPLLYAELNKRAAVESWHAFGKAQVVGASKVLGELGSAVIQSYDQAEEQSDRSLSSLAELQRYILAKIEEYYEAEVARLSKEKEALELEIQEARAMQVRGQMMEEVKDDSATGFEQQLKGITAELEEAQKIFLSLASSEVKLDQAQEVIVYASQDVVPTRLDPNKAIPVELV